MQNDTAVKVNRFADVEYQPFVVSSSTEPEADLRHRFARDGYLYLPGFLPRTQLQSLVDELLGVLHPHIIWDKSQDTPILRGEPFSESDAVWDQLYPRVQALESLHSLFHRPRLQSLMRCLAGGEAFVYPMKMARIAAPGKMGFETPAHQDAYSHHAGNTMAGLWVALHAVDERMGRLTILPKSHRRGVRPVHTARGVGGVQCEIYSDERVWHVSNVAAGDVVVFHSCTVHRAQPNVAATRVRLSVDTRFCDYGAPVYSTNLDPHHGWRIPGLDWDYVYRSWQDESLKHYWQDYPALF